MTTLQIHLRGEGCWPDLATRQFEWLQGEAKLQIARLEGTTKQGQSSVAIRLERPNGEVIVVETTMMLFLACARAFAIAEGELSAVPPGGAVQ